MPGLLTNLMKIMIALLLLPQPSSTQEKTPKRAEPVSTDAIESILNAFDRYTIVALGEGDHGNLQGATFRLALLRDPRFAEKVNDIVVEFGTGRYQPVMDRLFGDAHFFRPEEESGEGFFFNYMRGNCVQQFERLHPDSIFNITTMTRTEDILAPTLERAIAIAQGSPIRVGRTPASLSCKNPNT